MSSNLTGKYAAITSTAALIVALGGTGYAAGLIGTNGIKNGAITTPKLHGNAVTSAKVKNNAITGADVKESSLGTVPKAGSAGKVNGVTPYELNFLTTVNATRTILNAGTLVITASCGAGQVSVTANTTAPASKASIYATGITDGAPETPVQNDTEGGGMVAGVPFDLLLGTPGNITQVSFMYDVENGATITGTFSVNEYVNGGVDAGCNVQGHAFVS